MLKIFPGILILQFDSFMNIFRDPHNGRVSFPEASRVNRYSDFCPITTRFPYSISQEQQ